MGKISQQGVVQSLTNRVSEAPKSGRSGASLNSAGAEPGGWSAGAAPAVASFFATLVSGLNHASASDLASGQRTRPGSLPGRPGSCSLAAVSARAIRADVTASRDRLDASRRARQMLAADPSRIVSTGLAALSGWTTAESILDAWCCRCPEPASTSS